MAQMTSRISDADTRYAAVLAALAGCELAFRSEDLAAFQREAERVKRFTTFVPGAFVQWKDEKKRPCGPAAVLDVTIQDGRLWVWVEWQDQPRWISEIIIHSIKPEVANSASARGVAL